MRADLAPDILVQADPGAAGSSLSGTKSETSQVRAALPLR